MRNHAGAVISDTFISRHEPLSDLMTPAVVATSPTGGHEGGAVEHSLHSPSILGPNGKFMWQGYFWKTGKWQRNILFPSFLPNLWQRAGDVRAARGSRPEYPAGCHIHPGVCLSGPPSALLSAFAVRIEGGRSYTEVISNFLRHDIQLSFLEEASCPRLNQLV